MVEGDASARATYASMLECYQTIAARAHGAVIFEERGALGLVRSAEHPSPVVAIFELEGPSTDTDLEVIVRHYPTSTIFLLTGSSTGQSPCHDDLLALGFAHHVMPVMTLALATTDLDEAMPPGLRLEAVENDDGYRELTEVQIQTLGPGYQLRAALKRFLGLEHIGVAHHLLGRIDGRPVAAATALETGPIPTLWGIGTLEEYRGRGVGRAITLAACRIVRANGHRMVGLWATPPGQPVYERIGFRTVGLGGTYLLSQPST